MNPRANKQKGYVFEKAVVDSLVENGWPKAERRRTAGSQDKGDTINGPQDFTLEIKNEKSISLAQYMKEAAVEAKNAGTKWYAAIVKARGKSVEQSYVVMPLSQFLEICRVLEGADDAV